MPYNQTKNLPCNAHEDLQTLQWRIQSWDRYHILQTKENCDQNQILRQMQF